MTIHADLSAHRGAGGRHPAVDALLAAGVPDAGAVDAFVGGHAFPLVEPGWATFAFRGEAGQVDMLRWIHGGADRRGFERVPGTDLWLLRLAVEDAGRFEYKLAVAHDGREEWILDQLNPARAEDPFGQNSVARTLGYAQPEWSAPRGAPAGRIEEMAVESRAFGEWRFARLYLPAGHDPERAYPLVVIHDGDDFMTYTDLPVVLDNLIDAGDIPPVVAALVQTRDRPGEYARGRRHARYLVQELLPAVAARVRVSVDPADRVLLGEPRGRRLARDRLPLSGGLRGAGAAVGVFRPRRGKARAAAESGLWPHRPAAARLPPLAQPARGPGVRLHRRA